MPTYEYQCKACGHQLEAFQKITDEPLVDCPHCHQTSLTKLISAAGFQLKGEGWYKTDYSKSKPKDTDKGVGATTEKSSNEKVETKSTDSNKQATE